MKQDLLGFRQIPLDFHTHGSVEGPHALLAAVNRQPAEDRLVLHRLHCTPVRYNDTIDIVDDVVPLCDLRVSLRVEDTVKAVRGVPEMTDLAFVQEAGRVRFTVPMVNGYQVVAVE